MYAGTAPYFLWADSSASRDRVVDDASQNILGSARTGKCQQSLDTSDWIWHVESYHSIIDRTV